MAYYISGKVDFSRKGTDGFCEELGSYFAGVPTLDPTANFGFERGDISLLMHEGSPGVFIIF